MKVLTGLALLAVATVAYAADAGVVTLCSARPI